MTSCVCDLAFVNLVVCAVTFATMIKCHYVFPFIVCKCPLCGTQRLYLLQDHGDNILEPTVSKPALFLLLQLLASLRREYGYMEHH
jgi:hypothetical protein